MIKKEQDTKHYDYDDCKKASNPPPGSGLVDPDLGVGVGGPVLRGTNGTIGVTSAANLLMGGLLNIGKGPQKSEVGATEGGDCAEPPGVLFNGTEPCFLGADPAPRLDDGKGEPGWKLSSGRLKLRSGRSDVCVSPLGAENKGPATVPKKAEPVEDFCCVSRCEGGGGAKAALWLRIGSLRALRRAFFNL
jgi:hypothetical protein